MSIAEHESAVTSVDKIRHKQLKQWVLDVAAITKPDRIHWCDGSEREYQLMSRLMIQAGTAIPLNAQKRPNSILVRSNPADVARVEDRTFICSQNREEAGPNNYWEDPVRMKQQLTQ